VISIKKQISLIDDLKLSISNFQGKFFSYTLSKQYTWDH